MDAVYARSRARAVDSAEGEYLEGAIESAGELGISAIRGPWEISARVRYLGPYPLVPDNSRRAGSDEQVNLRAAHTHGRLTVYGELLNVFDDAGKEIVYWYDAHVPGLDPADVEVPGRLSRTAEPRTLRAGIKYSF